MKRIAILGSTGSIGTAVLDVVRLHPDRFCVVALAANNSIALLTQQVKEFNIKTVAVFDEHNQRAFATQTSAGVTSIPGMEGLEAVAGHPDADIVVNALVGSIGVLPTLRALKDGKRVALANKETLVMAGHLVMETAKTYGSEILPIDSEHGALHQCLHGGNTQEVKRILLTASGGPFRHTPIEKFPAITIQEALAHPTWTMGSKITIDSATMMNKGLEVIEARWLFDYSGEMITVVIHPESIIHSMVEFVDSSIISQLSNPDMRLPIQYALTYPERLRSDYAALDFFATAKLTFEKPDFKRFTCLQLAFDALATGGSMPCVLNAANEIAVAAFLAGTIAFTDIARLVSLAMNKHHSVQYNSLDEILEIDKWAREVSSAAIKQGVIK